MQDRSNIIKLNIKNNFMNSKIAIYSVFAIGAMALFGATLAITSAATPNNQGFGQRFGDRMKNHPHFEQMADIQAEALGLSVDEIKALRDEGKNFHEIVEESGVDMDVFHEKMRASHEAFLQEQVTAGNITQEQADERLEWMDERHEEGLREGGGMRHGDMGMHKGQGRGFSQK